MGEVMERGGRSRLSIVESGMRGRIRGMDEIGNVYIDLVYL
jgi:hypothetical protein